MHTGVYVEIHIRDQHTTDQGIPAIPTAKVMGGRIRHFMYLCTSHLCEEYGGGVAKQANNYLNLCWKIVRVKGSISYIERCLQNDLTPNFSRLKLANNKLRRNKNFHNKIQIEVSEEELKLMKHWREKITAVFTLIQSILWVCETHDIKIES
jgi:hypothetical protein